MTDFDTRFFDLIKNRKNKDFNPFHYIEKHELEDSIEITLEWIENRKDCWCTVKYYLEGTYIDEIKYNTSSGFALLLDSIIDCDYNEDESEEDDDSPFTGFVMLEDVVRQFLCIDIEDYEEDELYYILIPKIKERHLVLRIIDEIEQLENIIEDESED